MKILISVLVWGLISMNTFAAEISRDEAQIRSNLYGFSALADHNAYEYLGRMLAPTVKVDYTSLFGGETEHIARAELMKRWAAFLPGFDLTFHQLNAINVQVDDDSASASADFIARHWIGDDGFWSVAGTYLFTFKRSDGQWLITSITLTNPTEAGSRDVLSIAPERAAELLSKRLSNLLDYQ